MNDTEGKEPQGEQEGEVDNEKAIKDFVEMTAKHTLTLFKMLGLKTHIECFVINDPTREEFIFSFKTVEKFKQDLASPPPLPTQPTEELRFCLLEFHPGDWSTQQYRFHHWFADGGKQMALIESPTGQPLEVRALQIKFIERMTKH